MARDTAPARIAAQNRKARHDFFIEETLEAGIVLQGTEVKSLRQGGASIVESYAGPKHFGHEPRRPRKLLVKRRELGRLIGAVQRSGVTIVPLSIYFNDRGIAKVQL